LFYAHFSLMPFANLCHFLIFAVSFLFNVLWLAAFYCANPLFLMNIILICAPFFRGMQLGH
jgi:hypothetical protein